MEWQSFRTEEIFLKTMENLTRKSIKSVTKLKKAKYEKGLTLTNDEMKEPEKNLLKELMV